MNTYQKVLVCIFRTLGLLVTLYGVVLLVSSGIMMNGMLGLTLRMFAPFLGAGLFLYFAAVPISNIVTLGIED